MRKMLVDGDVEKIRVLIRVRKIIFKSVIIVNKSGAVLSHTLHLILHVVTVLLDRPKEE